MGKKKVDVENLDDTKKVATELGEDEARNVKGGANYSRLSDTDNLTETFIKITDIKGESTDSYLKFHKIDGEILSKKNYNKF